MQVIKRVLNVVASESEGRKIIQNYQVEPSRDCCVNAYGLLDLEGAVLLQFEWYRGLDLSMLVSKFCL